MEQRHKSNRLGWWGSRGGPDAQGAQDGAQPEPLEDTRQSLSKTIASLPARRTTLLCLALEGRQAMGRRQERVSNRGH